MYFLENNPANENLLETVCMKDKTTIYFFHCCNKSWNNTFEIFSLQNNRYKICNMECYHFKQLDECIIDDCVLEECIVVVVVVP